MTVTVSAPGKAFLIGEYGVLEGSLAVARGGDRRVRAVAHAAPPASRRRSSTPPPTRCAPTAIRTYLGAARLATIGVAPIINTGRCATPAAQARGLAQQ